MAFNLRKKQFLFLSIFALYSWTLFSACEGIIEGADIFYDIKKFITDGENTIHKWENTASQLKNASATPDEPILPLAAHRTRRIDPSNDFNYHETGWDITDSHYIQSLMFSGAPLFAIAVIWFFAVGLFSVIAIFCYFCCCCKHKPKVGYSRWAYALSLSFLVAFLIMALAGGAVLYYGQSNFHNSTTEVMNALVRKAAAVVDIVNHVLNNLAAAKKIGVGSYSLPDEYKKNIDFLEKLANHTARNPKSQAQKTTARAELFLKAVSRCLHLVTAVMLLLVVVGFIISICGWKVFVYIFLFFGWIIVTGTFMLCGISLIVENGVADTCVAMEDWLQHPQNLTALSKLLPCMDEDAAQNMFDTTKNTSYQMANLVNGFIMNVANADVPPMVQDLYYNQSGPLMPLVCNPFNPNLTERECDPSEVELKSAPQAYQNFVCVASPLGICTTMGRMTPNFYSQMMVATNMSETLHRHGPLLVALADCTFVEDTFREISKEHCPGLRRNSSQVFIGLVLVSSAVMCSVILWVVYVRERQYHISSKKFRKAHVGY